MHSNIVALLKGVTLNLLLIAQNAFVAISIQTACYLAFDFAIDVNELSSELVIDDFLPGV